MKYISFQARTFIVVLLTQKCHTVIGQCGPNQFQDSSSVCLDCVNGTLDLDLSISPPVPIDCICPSPLLENMSADGSIECVAQTSSPTSTPVVAPIDVPTIAPTSDSSLAPVSSAPAATPTPTMSPTSSPTAMPRTIVEIILTLAGVDADDIDGALDDIADTVKAALSLPMEYDVTAMIVDTQPNSIIVTSTLLALPQVVGNSVDVIVTIEGQPTSSQPPLTLTSILDAVDDARDDLADALKKANPDAFDDLQSLDASAAPTDTPTAGPIDIEPTMSAQPSAPVSAPVAVAPTSAPAIIDSDDQVCPDVLFVSREVMHWKFIFICKEYCVVTYLATIMGFLGFKDGPCIQ